MNTNTNTNNNNDKNKLLIDNINTTPYLPILFTRLGLRIYKYTEQPYIICYNDIKYSTIYNTHAYNINYVIGNDIRLKNNYQYIKSFIYEFVTTWDYRIQDLITLLMINIKDNKIKSFQLNARIQTNSTYYHIYRINDEFTILLQQGLNEISYLIDVYNKIKISRNRNYRYRSDFYFTKDIDYKRADLQYVFNRFTEKKRIAELDYSITEPHEFIRVTYKPIRFKRGYLSIVNKVDIKDKGSPDLRGLLKPKGDNYDNVNNEMILNNKDNELPVISRHKQRILKRRFYLQNKYSCYDVNKKKFKRFLEKYDDIKNDYKDFSINDYANRRFYRNKGYKRLQLDKEQEYDYDEIY